MNLFRAIVQSYNARFLWPRQHNNVFFHCDVDAILGPFLLHVLGQLVAFIRSREMRYFGVKPAIRVSCQILTRV